MNKQVADFLERFTTALNPLEKNIRSLIIHGSSVYSEELKKHQDLDLLLVFEKYDYPILKKFKEVLEKFCKTETNSAQHTYYSIAGSGRTSIEKEAPENKQVFRLELFVSDRRRIEIDWKTNTTFPQSLVSNSKRIMGEDILYLADYAGEMLNPRLGTMSFNKLQWLYCALLEFGYDEDIILRGGEEAVFNKVRHVLTMYGNMDVRKDHVFEDFIKLFPQESKKYESVINCTKQLRLGEKINVSALDYLRLVEELNNFVENKVNERIR